MALNTAKPATTLAEQVPGLQSFAELGSAPLAHLYKVLETSLQAGIKVDPQCEPSSLQTQSGGVHVGPDEVSRQIFPLGQESFFVGSILFPPQV